MRGVAACGVRGVCGVGGVGVELGVGLNGLERTKLEDGVGVGVGVVVAVGVGFHR